MADPFLSQTVALPNVPTTALEQLQLATERKAASMAAAHGSGLPPQASAVALGKALSAIPSASGSFISNKDESQLPKMAYNDVPTWAPLSNIPAVQAIQNMTMEDSNPGAAPAGDPWASMRGGSPAVPAPGMVTNNTGRNIASHLPAGSPIEGLSTGGLGGLFANTPIGRFIGGLSAMGPQRAAPQGLAALPAAPRPAQGTYDPRVDVTGMARQQGQNAGGWGINAGGGIVPF